MPSGSGTRKYKVRARVPVGAPTGQQGMVNMPGVLPWSAFTWVDQLEDVPELQWPTSIKTYNHMRTDSQVSGLYLGVTMPIRRYKWVVAPNGAPDQVVRGIAEDFNLPIQGEEKKNTGRIGRQFHWDNALRHFLLGLAYGFYYFELVGEVRNNVWRMNDLAARPPSSIAQVNIDSQGNLVNVKQAVGVNAQPLDANRLVPFVWDREAGNWFGRSLFRSMYRHWLLKDMLYRIDAIKHERTGLGIPTVEMGPGSTPRQREMAEAVAQRWRAGDYAGVALPNGAKMRLVGTEGSVPDTLGSIREHNEAMARSLLMMFVQLGQTHTGSRALGESFIDYFSLAQETIALWIEDTLAEFVTERWVDFNYGPDVSAPRITHERDTNPDLSVQDLAALAQQGMITVDPELETYLRDRYLLPPKPESSVVPVPAAPSATELQPETPTLAPVAARRKATVQAAVDSLLPLPNRALRRQPYEQEVRAMVDFASMDSDYDLAKSALVNAVRQAQGGQIQALKEAIIAAGNNLKKIANVSAPAVHAATIQARLVQMANTGAMQAIAEAAKQGKVLAMPDLSNVIGRLSSRATATDMLLAGSLSDAAARKALSLAGSVKTPQEVADQTAQYLSGLSTRYLEDQLGGALQQAMNAGRKEVISSGNPNEIYSSELLDSSTCEPCVDIDGTEYPDLDAAEADYPTGGYMDCLGGPRCRGTLIAVYGGEV